jgi:hypothetical protein
MRIQLNRQVQYGRGNSELEAVLIDEPTSMDDLVAKLNAVKPERDDILLVSIDFPKEVLDTFVQAVGFPALTRDPKEYISRSSGQYYVIYRTSGVQDHSFTLDDIAEWSARQPQ